MIRKVGDAGREHSQKMVLIGGGLFKEMPPFLEEIVCLSGKKNPRVLVLPTAGYDSENAFAIWKELFTPLGCDVSPLYLTKGNRHVADYLSEHRGDLAKEDFAALRNGDLTDEEIAQSISQSDIIYVPGGDSNFMTRLWRGMGVDKLLRIAFEEGAVISGRSAGAVCWFREFCGADWTADVDSERFICYHRRTGLGWIDGAICTHYSDRKEPFRVMLRKFGGAGIGIDDDCAIFIDSEKYRILSLGPNRHAYRVGFKDDTFYEEPLSESGKSKDILDFSH